MTRRILSRLITLVSLAAPRTQRAAWREEWLGELEQIARTRGTRTAIRVALGAAPDALALRRLAGAAGEGTGVMRSWSAMDFTLAGRMLVRYPGLTTVGVVGMAVGIAIAAGTFSVIYTLTTATLPLADGERIVTILTRDVKANAPERRMLHDVAAWRDELASVEDLSAYRQVTRNLIAVGVQTEPVRIAEISASGFRVARVPPLLGRPVLESDERRGAPAVLVIGYDAWQVRFAADPRVVGRQVRLGGIVHTIVGVMPEGFLFPIDHQFWIPLRIDAADYPRRRGPSVVTFGRLRRGVTLAEAQAELSALSARTAAEHPETHAYLRPTVLPFTYPFFDINDPSMARLYRSFTYLVTLLLVVVCINVAILVYARTATRHAEIVIRSALGASRARIVGQLFTEALMLSAVAAAVGLAFTSFGLREATAAMRQGLGQTPFWWRFELSPGVVAYVVVLTGLCAVIVGILPALKATGRRVQLSLQGISAGSGSGMRLGKTWTALVVLQVAIAVALLPAVVSHAWEYSYGGMAGPGFPAHEFLAADLLLDAQATAPDVAGRYAARHAELIARLEAEPAISDVTFASSWVGSESAAWIEADGIANPADTESAQGGYAIREGTKAGHQVRFSRIDPSFFDAFDVPLLAGRVFTQGDAAPGGAAVIVNRAFAATLFGQHAPLGRRVRYVGVARDAADVELSRWYEVVGVVADFPDTMRKADAFSPKLYHAARVEDMYPCVLSMRVRGTTAGAFAGRLREITAAVDPALQVRNLQSLDAALSREQRMVRLAAIGLVVVTLAVVALATAGVYALMSFTITQRRKEIGIRAALGAEPRRLIFSIFSRTVMQLAIGAAAGAAAAALLDEATGGEMMRGRELAVLPIVATFMMVVGLVAAVGPARRGLRVHPTEALRQE